MACRLTSNLILLTLELDGFRPEEIEAGKQKGMRRRGPRQGMPNAADPATVEQRGFSIRF